VYPPSRRWLKLTNTCPAGCPGLLEPGAVPGLPHRPGEDSCLAHHPNGVASSDPAITAMDTDGERSTPKPASTSHHVSPKPPAPTHDHTQTPPAPPKSVTNPRSAPPARTDPQAGFMVATTSAQPGSTREPANRTTRRQTSTRPHSGHPTQRRPANVSAFTHFP